MKRDFNRRVDRALASVRKRTDAEPGVGVILGSGLSSVADYIDGLEIPYSAIDEMPIGSVSGHSGILKIGEKVIVLAGRLHYYEGQDTDDLILSVVLLKRLGVKKLIITNAAGAVNLDYVPGDIILLKDHINYMGMNPLMGPNTEELGPRFPDMSDPYSKELRSLVQQVKPLREGVYMAFNGPSYETPAEVRMARILGADLVGMSTVPEVIVANYVGLEVIGLSCATNMAAGVLDKPLDHQEVISVGKQVQGEMVELIMGILKRLVPECWDPGLDTSQARTS